MKKKYDWIKIKNYYITHEVSLAETAKKFGTSFSMMKEHSRLEQWNKLRDEKRIEIDKQVSQKITEREIDRKVKANEKHNELYEKGLEVAELLLETYLEELKSGKSKKANAYNLDFIMKAIANAQKGQRTALNIEAKETEEKTEPEITIIEGLNIDKI